MRLVLLAFLIGLAGAAGAERPARVVSMNLCTDQLALMVAEPGQMISVSDWGARPNASNLPEQAAALPLNHGSAEQIFLMRPDLVLAGTFTSQASIAMLRRLGIRVEVFGAAQSFAEVSAHIHRIGGLLGREEAADALDREFQNGLSALADRIAAHPRSRAAYHYPNNYTSGAGTLAHEVLDRAGLDNVAASELGLTATAVLGLEQLVMLDPFLIRTETLSGATEGRAYEGAAHPALAALIARGGGTTIPERWQVCGTPFLLRAVAALIDARFAE
ncbi:MAG: ABC transporter substrate-binding protein, partial [Pseudomonadota bacterium]